ncbi:hypothetical protein M758_UG282500 [Ceratodon purpureus]|nr:hypothetical protein M758_UG282500 [Ceratodon purpureus]
MFDRDQRKDSPLRSEIRKTRDSDNRRSWDSPSRLEDSRTRDVSPRVSKQQRGVSEPYSDTRAPTVDEFGRFIRPGGSESDVEDSCMIGEEEVEVQVGAGVDLQPPAGDDGVGVGL